VQAPEVTSLADRRLVPARDVRQGGHAVVVPVGPAQQLEIDRRELLPLAVVQRGQVGDVAVRREVHLDRPARRRRDVGRPPLPGEYHPRAGSALGGQQVGQQVAAGPLPVRRGLGEHPLGPRRHERVGVDLPVRVVQRDPDLLAAVLEAEHLAHAGQPGQLLGPLCPRLDHRAHPRRAARRTTRCGRR
jgi:hypothetical protein